MNALPPKRPHDQAAQMATELHAQAARFLAAVAHGEPTATPAPMVIDLGPAGNAEAMSVDQLMDLVRSAKTRVKASARGWSMLSQREIVALAWFADLLVADGPEALATPSTPAAAPAVISEI